VRVKMPNNKLLKCATFEFNLWSLFNDGFEN
jgi:hypothetical protein